MTQRNISIFIRKTIYIEKRQDTAIKALSDERTVESEHIRRGIDIYLYLRRPENAALLTQIQAALVELEKKPEALPEQQHQI